MSQPISHKYVSLAAAATSTRVKQDAANSRIHEARNEGHHHGHSRMGGRVRRHESPEATFSHAHVNHVHAHHRRTSTRCAQAKTMSMQESAIRA